MPETDAVSKSMESMINLDGAGLILATSFGYYKPFVVDLAKKYPDVEFRHAAPLWNKDKDPKNAGSYFGYLNQAHYVDGVAAGLSTKTNKLGFVAAKPIASVLSNINSFMLGARSVNPKATVQVSSPATGRCRCAKRSPPTRWSTPAATSSPATSTGRRSSSRRPRSAASRAAATTRARRRWRRRASSPAPNTSGSRSTRATPRISPRASRCQTSPPADTRSTSSRTRRSAPARPEAGKRRALAAIEGLKAKKPIYVGPLKDNKTGKVVIDKTYDNLDPVPRQDGLPAGGRRRLDDLKAEGEEPVSNPPVATGAPRGMVDPVASRAAGSDFVDRLRANSEYVVIPLFALLVAAALFAVFLLAIGKSPVDFVSYVWRGGFGTAFSLQNTLQRSAPLILTALAVAIPARIGLIMIGGEGALVLGGFAAGGARAFRCSAASRRCRRSSSCRDRRHDRRRLLGRHLPAILRYARGVNETISSLLLTYIGIAIMNFFVEGALRDLSNPNKPSTKPIGDAYMVGKIPGTEVHWGLAFGLALCVALYFLMSRTTFGFAARVTGGNFRAALAQGLPVGRLIVACSAIAGACAGLAGFFEVAAIQGRANASLAAGYGFTGILVSFLARHNPLAISAGRDPVRRTGRLGRPHPAAHGSARRDGAGAAGPDLRRSADLGNALRAVRDLPAGRATGPHMNARRRHQFSSPCSAARSAFRRRSCSSRSANA